MLVRCITGLTLIEASTFLLIGDNLITIDEFFRHIKTIMTCPIPQHKLYHKMIAKRQYNAMEGEVAQHVIHHSYIAPTIQAYIQSDVRARIHPKDEDGLSISSSTMKIPRSPFRWIQPRTNAEIPNRVGC